MEFSSIPGLQHIKNHLQSTLKSNRTAHAQLFTGRPGYGTLATAFAFAQALITQNLEGEQLRKANHLSSRFQHPDLHAIYPVNTSALVEGKNPSSKDFSHLWREFILENPYRELHDWYKSIGIENKQGLIKVNEADEIGKLLSLKSYGGNAKVMLIWQAEKMHPSTANKLLKLIEEPPENTFLILISDQPEDILLTIRSRCQILEFPPFNEDVIANYLTEKKGLSLSEAHQIAVQSDGDLGIALKKIDEQNDERKFENYFITWVRSAFMAKKKKSVVKDLMNWALLLDKENRETQKRFLDYCLNFFRQAMLQNYQASSLVYLRTHDANFNFAKFSQFINGNNLVKINAALKEASSHIERNANGKIVFTDLSLQLTRYLHQK